MANGHLNCISDVCFLLNKRDNDSLIFIFVLNKVHLISFTFNFRKHDKNHPTIVSVHDIVEINIDSIEDRQVKGLWKIIKGFYLKAVQMN